MPASTPWTAELGWWIEDHPIFVLTVHIAVIVLCAASLWALAVRFTSRRRRASPIGGWRVARTVCLGILTALVGLMFAGGLAKIGPRLWHHAAMLGEDGARLRFRRLADDVSTAPDPTGHDATVVILWATWCRPCVEEFEFLGRLRRDRPTVQFIHLSREDPATLRDFLEAHPEAGTGSSHGYVDAEGWWPAHRLPTALVLDGRGQIAAMMQGSASYERLTHTIDQIRAGPSP